MTGLDLLLHAEDLRREIARREERIAILRRLAGAVSRPLPGDVRVVSSPDPGRNQRLLDEAVDEQEAVRLLREELEAADADLALLFSLLPDALTASVLQIRYLEKQPWREVCLRTHLSRTRVFARHRQALELLAARDGNSCIPGPNRGILSEADETK